MVQVLADQGRGLFRNRLPYQRRTYVLHGPSVRVQDLLHHMGLIIITAVDDRRKSGSHLYHGRIIALPERAGRKLGHSQRVLVEHRRGIVRLARKVDVRLQAKIEDLLILQIVLIAQHGADLHQSVVAGKHQSPFQGDKSVSGPLRAFDSGLSLHHSLTAIADKGVGIRNYAQLQGRRHRQRLYRRPRLIAVADAEISPHLVSGVQELFLAHGVRLFLGQISVFHQVVRIVQIVIHIRCHGQNLPVLGIHHDDADILCRRPFCVLIGVILYKLVNVFFHNLLQRRVNGGYHRVSVRGLAHHCGLLQILIQVFVASAVGSIQHIAVFLLNSRLALISRHRVANHMTGQGIIGITPDIGILKPDALDPRSGLVVLHQRFKFRNLILGQLTQEHHVAAVNSVIVGGAELRLIQTEILNQSLKGRLHAVLVRVLLVRILGEHLRVQNQVVYLFTGGQNRPVPVQNISPSVGKQRAVRVLLGQHSFCIFVAVGLVDIRQAHIYSN